MSVINPRMDNKILDLFKQGLSINEIIEYFHMFDSPITFKQVNEVLRKNIRDDL